MNKAVAAPKTKTEALARMNTIIAGEAINQDAHLDGPVTRQTVFHDHWMFSVCRNEAVKNSWSLKNGHPTWTSGDTAQQFLNQLDLPE